MIRLVAGILLLALAAPAGAADIRVHRETLSNGLVVQVVARPALPIVTVELGVRAGASRDPAGRAGTANLVAALLTEGTATRSAADIAEAIEFVGGSIGAEAERDYATAALSVLSRDLAMGLEVLADVARHPAFAPQELERVRGEVAGAIRADEDDPGRVAAKAFDRALFGDHPYARPVEGDADSLAAITRDDLAAFHAALYVPNNAVLSFVGNVTPEQARALAIQAFGDWPRRPLAAEPAQAPPALPHSHLVALDRPVTQANVVLGHVGIARDNPDFYPVLVMNYVLGGGGFTSRVVKSVRDEQGLAYSVYTAFDARRQPGTFSAVFQTRNDNANQAIASVLAELRRIQAEPVTERELDEARSYLEGSFPLRLDTNRKTAHLLTFIEMHGLGLDYFDDYLARIRRVTAADVRRVAREYLRPDAMLWVVVADQEAAALAAP